MSIKEKFKNLASSGLNKLPPSANLFLRYYTGLGSKGLDLSDDYLNKVRELGFSVQVLIQVKILLQELVCGMNLVS